MNVKLIFEYRLLDLKSLGFLSYELYLQSDLWRSIRRRVLERDQQKCCLCDEKAKQVHHKRYDLATLKGNDLSQLFSLCRDCHRTIEFDENDKKRPYWDIYKINQHLKRSSDPFVRIKRIEENVEDDKKYAAMRAIKADESRARFGYSKKGRR